MNLYNDLFGGDIISTKTTVHTGVNLATVYGGVGRFENLLTYSEQFDNAAWSKGAAVSVTANSVFAPDGQNTAERVVASAANNTHFVRQSIVVGSLTYTFSIYAKKDTYRYIALKTGQAVPGAVFDFDTETFVVSGSANVNKFQRLTNGWYRLTSTVNNASGTNTFGIYISDVSGNDSWSSSGSEAFWIWGAQLEQDTNANVYVKVEGSSQAVSYGLLTNRSLVSTLDAGTAPFVIASNTLVTNLNADLLDGHDSTFFAPAANISGTLNTIAKFSSTTAVGNSSITDNGTFITLGEQLNFGKAGAFSTSGLFNNGILDYDTSSGVLSLNSYDTGGNSEIRFSTSNAGTNTRVWTMSNTGSLISSGAQTISTTTGALTLSTGAANGNVIITPNGTGNLTVNCAIAAGSNTITSGLINSQTISSAANFTGSLAVASFLGVQQSPSTDRAIYATFAGAVTANCFGMVLTNASTSATNSIGKYGIYIDTSGTFSGTGTTSYGLYIAAIGTAVTKYAINNQSGADVFLGSGTATSGNLVASTLLAVGTTTSSDRAISCAYGGAVTAYTYGMVLVNLATSATNAIGKMGLYIDTTGTYSGTGTNNYGIYINAIGTAVGSYAFYNATAATVYTGSGAFSHGTAGQFNIGSTGNFSAGTMNGQTISSAANFTGSLTMAGALSGVTTLGCGAITSTGALALGSNTITSGLINGQTISSAANFTGSLNVASTLTVNSATLTDRAAYITYNAAATVTSYGIVLLNNATSATNVVGKIGLYVDTTGTYSGTGTFNYGIFINAIGTSTASYALYNGSGKDMYAGSGNFFQGSSNQFTVNGSGNITACGSIVCGTINGQTISSSASFTGTVISSSSVTSSSNGIFSNGSLAGFAFADRVGGNTWEWYGSTTARLYNGTTDVVTISTGGVLGATSFTGAGTGLTGTASSLTAGAVPASGITGTILATSMPALTGDVTSSAGAVATTIAANAVTLAKMATITTASFLGRSTASTGNVEVLSATTTRAILSISNVENTALSTWAGSSNLTTAGALTATSFTGSGSGLSSATVPIASLVSGDYSAKVTSGTYSITVTGGSGSATTTAITDDTTTAATMYPTWVTTTSGNLPQKISSTKLTFNPSTGLLTSTTFAGAGTSLTGTAASLTAGVATVAVALQTARAINGTNFDGTAPITVTADANTLSGTTLHSTIVTSSLTSVGTLGSLSVGAITSTGALALGANTVTCGGITSSGALALGTNNVACGPITASGTLILSGAAPQISLTNATSNWIDYGIVGVAAPAFTTTSVGTKLILYKEIDGTHANYAIGINTSELWCSVSISTAVFKWYGGTTAVMDLTSGVLNTSSGYKVAGSAFVDASRNITCGTVTSGNINGQTISSTASLTGSLAITGALTGVTTLATSSTINSQTISSTASLTGSLAVATNLGVGMAVDPNVAINVTMSGTVTSNRHGIAIHNTASGATNSAIKYGLFLDLSGNLTGTTTTIYGILINALGTATSTAYALYNATSGPMYLGSGNTECGTFTCDGAATITGNLSASANVYGSLFAPSSSYTNGSNVNTGNFRAGPSNSSTADPTASTVFSGFRVQFTTGYGASFETWNGSNTVNSGLIVWNSGTPSRWFDRTYNSTTTILTGNLTITQTTGTAPLTISSTTLVSNLTSQYLGASGQDAAYFTNASHLNAGTVPTAQLGSGSATSSTFLRGDQTWATVTASTSFANPSALVGLSAVNGVSTTTAMRSDGAPALDQSIIPTWTGKHIWQDATTTTLFSSADQMVTLSTSSVSASNLTHKCSPFLSLSANIWTGANTAKLFSFQNQGISGQTSKYQLSIRSTDIGDILLLSGDTGAASFASTLNCVGAFGCGAVTCGAITSSGTLNLGANTINCGLVSSTAIQASAASTTYGVLYSSTTKSTTTNNIIDSFVQQEKRTTSTSLAAMPAVASLSTSFGYMVRAAVRARDTTTGKTNVYDIVAKVSWVSSAWILTQTALASIVNDNPSWTCVFAMSSSDLVLNVTAAGTSTNAVDWHAGIWYSAV